MSTRRFLSVTLTIALVAVSLGLVVGTVFSDKTTKIASVKPAACTKGCCGQTPSEASNAIAIKSEPDPVFPDLSAAEASSYEENLAKLLDISDLYAEHRSIKLQQLFTEWAASDPEAAALASLRLTVLADRAFAQQEILTNWMARDWQAAAEWTLGLSLDNSALARHAKSLISHALQSSEEQALWLLARLPADAKSPVVSLLAKHQMFKKNMPAQELANWALGAAVVEGFDSSAKVFVGPWLDHDPDSLTDWMTTLDAAKQEIIARQIAIRTIEDFPMWTVDVAEAIPHSPTRTELMRSGLDAWFIEAGESPATYDFVNNWVQERKSDPAYPELIGFLASRKVGEDPDAAIALIEDNLGNSEAAQNALRQVLVTLHAKDGKGTVERLAAMNQSNDWKQEMRDFLPTVLWFHAEHDHNATAHVKNASGSHH